MGNGAINELITAEECLQNFSSEQLSCNKMSVLREGYRSEYIFQNNVGTEFVLYLQIMKEGTLFIGIGHISSNLYKEDEYNQMRYKMSRGVHALIELLNGKETTRLLRLIYGNEWCQLGATIIPDIYRYPDLIKPEYEKVLKSEIKKKIKNLKFSKQPNGKIVFIQGEEGKNIARVLKQLGIVENIYKSDYTETEVSLSKKYEDKNLILPLLKELGYSAI